MSTTPVLPPLPVWFGETDRMLALLNAGFPPVHLMPAADARAAIAARVRPIDNADDVASAEDRLIDGTLRVRVYLPKRLTAVPSPAIVYMHGGGFVFCSVESHDGFCRRMARHTGAVVVSVDYRLAPEHQAPAAAEDAAKAFAWTVSNAASLDIDGGRVLVAGDSAGGNLAAVVCLMARKSDRPMPCGQVLLYPMIGHDFDTPSYKAHGVGYYNTEASLRWYWEQYLGGNPSAEILEKTVPNLASNHAGLPPAIVYVAGQDPLASEGDAFARTLKEAGVNVRHRHFADQFHGFCTMAGYGPALSAQEVLWADIRSLFAGEK